MTDGHTQTHTQNRVAIHTHTQQRWNNIRIGLKATRPSKTCAQGVLCIEEAHFAPCLIVWPQLDDGWLSCCLFVRKWKCRLTNGETLSASGLKFVLFLFATHSELDEFLKKKQKNRFFDFVANRSSDGSSGFFIGPSFEFFLFYFVIPQRLWPIHCLYC